jgi:hypothetical protein
MVDLIDLPNTGIPVEHFETEEALSDYTKDTSNYLSKENALEGGILKYLRRSIFRPRKSKKSKKSNAVSGTATVE